MGNSTCKSYNLTKSKTLKINKDDYNACMQLSKEAQDDLHWWTDYNVYSNNPINHGSPLITLETDASSKDKGVLSLLLIKVLMLVVTG